MSSLSSEGSESETKVPAGERLSWLSFQPQVCGVTVPFFSWWLHPRSLCLLLGGLFPVCFYSVSSCIDDQLKQLLCVVVTKCWGQSPNESI